MNEVVDLSTQLGAIRDQGNRGTCLAFATTTAHESARVGRRGGEREELSEELLYWACKQIDGDFEEGTIPESAIEALRETGQSTAALWPYDVSRDDSNASYQPPAEALLPSSLRRATLTPISLGLAELKTALRKGRVVVLAIDLWDDFFDAGVGVVSSPAASDLLGDGHAVALVGFDEVKGTVLVRNSWGTKDWGDGGLCTLAEDAVAVVCFGAWTVTDDIDS